MSKITTTQISEIAKNNKIEPAALMAFLEVESGGTGFDRTTGKIIIQFEPSWFRKKAPYAPTGKWSVNGVDRQLAEWEAFNSAFRINPNAAMESTSLGMPQIMGIHYRLLGYKTVGEMWDDFKRGEYQQVLALVRFIKANAALYKAIQLKDWHTVASIYNGASYQRMAKQWGREPYNVSMAKAYGRYKTIM